MGDSLLYKAATNGIPLVDITVQFRLGVDFHEATRKFNSLAEDLNLHPGDWYNQPNLRSGAATAEALYRIFGWKLHREPLCNVNELTGQIEETEWFWWGELEPRCKMPDLLDGLVEEIGFSQPGADDKGQWYEPDFT